MTKLT